MFQSTVTYSNSYDSSTDDIDSAGGSFLFNSEAKGITICGVSKDFRAPRGAYFCDVSRVEILDNSVIPSHGELWGNPIDAKILDVHGTKVAIDSRSTILDDLSMYDPSAYTFAYISLPKEPFSAAVIRFEKSKMTEDEIVEWLGGIIH